MRLAQWLLLLVLWSDTAFLSFRLLLSWRAMRSLAIKVQFINFAHDAGSLSAICGGFVDTEDAFMLEGFVFKWFSCFLSVVNVESMLWRWAIAATFLKKRVLYNWKMIIMDVGISSVAQSSSFMVIFFECQTCVQLACVKLANLVILYGCRKLLRRVHLQLVVEWFLLGFFLIYITLLMYFD